MSRKSRARAAAATAIQVEPPLQPEVSSFRWSILLVAGIIVFAALVAYHNSFSGPFILDDGWSVTDNPTIKHFGSASLSPTKAKMGGKKCLRGVRLIAKPGVA